MPIAASFGNKLFGGNIKRVYNSPAYPAPPTTIDYVMIAGGGGAGGGGNPRIQVSGGGGAGGYLAGVGASVTHSVNYIIAVGAGGAVGTPTPAPGTPGSGATSYGQSGGNSGIFSSNTGTTVVPWAQGGGGGGGGWWNGPQGDPFYTFGLGGQNGASGGGGANKASGTNSGTGTAPQGTSGGGGARNDYGNPVYPTNMGDGNGGGGGGAGFAGMRGLGYGNADDAAPLFPGPGAPTWSNPGWRVGTAPSNGGHGGQGVTVTFDGGTSYIGGGGGGGNDLGPVSGSFDSRTSSYGGRAPNWQGQGAYSSGYPAPWNGNPYGGGSGAGSVAYPGYPSYSVNGGSATGGGGGGASSGAGVPGSEGSSGGSGGSGFVWIKYPSTAAELAETTGLESYTDNGTSRIYKWSGAGSFKWYAPGINPFP